MPAHKKTSLTQTGLSNPVEGGRPALGTWQRDLPVRAPRGPHSHEVVLHLIGA